VTRTFNRILLEAGSAATNCRSRAHREISARELAHIDTVELALDGAAKTHLALALCEAVVALSRLTDASAIDSAAVGIRALVAAAWAEPAERLNRAPMTAPHYYWIDG